MMADHIKRVLKNHFSGFKNQEEILVVIVNYNAKEYINNCLRHLSFQTYAKFNALVVDNASEDDYRTYLRLPDNRFEVAALNKNMGFAFANNLAARLSPSKYIVTLNPDAFPRKNWLAKLVCAIERDDNIAAAGSMQLNAQMPEIIDSTGDALFFAGYPWKGGNGQLLTDLSKTRGESFSVSAAAALYRTAAFKAVGGFDDDFFCYFEDVDLGFRLRLNGFGILYEPQAVVRHVDGGTSKQIPGFTHYHCHRNLLWMHIKNMPWALLLITLPTYLLIEIYFWLKLFLRGFLGNKQEDKEYLRIRVSAFFSSIRSLPGMLEKRKVIQTRKTIPTYTIAKALSWNPFKFIKRLPDIKAL